MQPQPAFPELAGARAQAWQLENRRLQKRCPNHRERPARSACLRSTLNASLGKENPSMLDLTFALFLLICMTYTQTHTQRHVSKYTSTNVCV